MIISYLAFFAFVVGLFLLVAHLFDRPVTTSTQRVLRGAQRIRISRAIQSPDFHQRALNSFSESFVRSLAK